MTTVQKALSRKWKLTKAIFIVSNTLGIAILTLSYFLGAEAWNNTVSPVLTYLGTVNSLTAVSYNAANAYGKKHGDIT